MRNRAASIQTMAKNLQGVHKISDHQDTDAHKKQRRAGPDDREQNADENTDEHNPLLDLQKLPQMRPERLLPGFEINGEWPPWMLTT